MTRQHRNDVARFSKSELHPYNNANTFLLHLERFSDIGPKIRGLTPFNDSGKWLERPYSYERLRNSCFVFGNSLLQKLTGFQQLSPNLNVPSRKQGLNVLSILRTLQVCLPLSSLRENAEDP